MSSNVPKPETDEQESDSYQYEQDQACDGDEVFAVKGKGKGGFFKGTCFKCGMRGHKADRCWQKGKGKGGKGGWQKGKSGSKGNGWSKKENGQILVTRGTVLGIIPIGTAKRMVSRWIRGLLLNLFHISVQCSSCEEFSEPKRMSRGTPTKTLLPGREFKKFRSR